MDGTDQGGDPTTQPEATPAAPPVTRRGSLAKRCVACALVLYHMAAVTIGNLTESGALGQALHRYVNPYLRLMGQWQEWDMFTTIPLYQRIDSKLVARSQDGKETRYEPLLPGFTEVPDSLRLVSMFARVVWARKNFRWHVDRYLRAACYAVAEREGSTPRSVRVELDTLTIRQLSAVRRDGVIGDPRTFKSEEMQCPR